MTSPSDNHDSLRQAKTDLRRNMRKLKSLLTVQEAAERSAAIMELVEQTDAFGHADVVLLYWSMADEVQTHAFVERWYRQKTLLLPCVDGDNLRLRQYTGTDCLVPGEQFGIGEPTGPEWTDLGAVQLIVVPGVAFDSAGHRMGRGRGFYDRLLASTPSAVKMGIAYGFQVLDTIPTEPHDIKMDLIIHD